MFDIVFDFLIEYIGFLGWYIPMLVVFTFIGYLTWGGRKNG